MKVILFSNDGCGSCKTWKPVFEKLMNQYKLEYQEVNMYDPKNRDIVKQYDVHGIPYTVFVGDNSQKLGDILGNMNEELAERDIKYYMSLDGLGEAQE